MAPDPAPTKAEAMKAVLTQERFSDPDWIFERKLDGIRCIAIRDGGPVRLLSRNDLSLNGRFPGVAEALDAQANSRFAIDGEVVAFEHGQTSFQRLGHPGAAIVYYVFDVLWLDGRDVRGLPLRERKALLRDALSFDEGAIRLSAYRNEAGEAMFEEACKSGWEGVIAKRADSVYTPSRSRDWLKFKCEAGQELVIGGFTAPRGSREEFGALLVGVYDASGRVALRRQGRHGLRPRDAAIAGRAAARAATRGVAVRGRPALPRRDLGRAVARGPDRVRGMDDRGSPAPPALPGAARRQGRAVSRPRGSVSA